jgi:pimeloyl-ACP methyl ester carboxylesterase
MQMLEQSLQTSGAAAPRVATGRHVELAEGTAYVRIDGPESGNPLVLVHGEAQSCDAFDALVPYLTSAGFRTLRFDLFGHGRSDEARCAYTTELYARQTLDVVAATGFARPAAVVGLSLGAAFAAAAANRRPGWVDRLAVIAPRLYSIALFGDGSDDYAALRGLRCEVLVVAGGADHVTPTAEVACVRHLLPSHRYVEVGGADHDLLATDPEPLAAVVRWFAEPLGPRLPLHAA